MVHFNEETHNVRETTLYGLYCQGFQTPSKLLGGFLITSSLCRDDAVVYLVTWRRISVQISHLTGR
jgi:hypothetical protein